MYILKQEVEKILEVMNEYPDARGFRLEESGHSGIGSIMTLVVETKINARDVEVSIEIAGVESW